MNNKEQLKKLGKLYIEIGELCNKAVALIEKEEAGEIVPDSEMSEIIGAYMVKLMELQKVANG